MFLVLFHNALIFVTCSNKDLTFRMNFVFEVLLEYSKLALGETSVDDCRSEDILATKHRSLQCRCHEINEIKVLVRPVCACQP